MKFCSPNWPVAVCVLTERKNKGLQATFENAIILFVCPPKFCISIVFDFSSKSHEKLETMLMQNLWEKQRVLWYFRKWLICYGCED